MTALDVLRVGAVTPLGLSAPTTCAAFRAGLKGLEVVYHRTFPASPVTGGRVPGSIKLRRTYLDWLVNLASRAVREVLDEEGVAASTALLVTVPGRQHSGLSGDSPRAIVDGIQRRIGNRFPIAEAVCAGRAGTVAAFARARELLASGRVAFCCVAGVDSLVNAYDIARLERERRLVDEQRPMGVLPGEGAACVLVGPAGRVDGALARIVGVGLGTTGAESTDARGLREAFERALADAGVHESAVGFVVTAHTGERQRAIDYTIAEMRTFRTLRHAMPHWMFVASAGDLCAASGALTVVLAATAYAKGYAPGSVAVCAASSDDGQHAACVVQAARQDQGGMTSPFDGSDRNVHRGTAMVPGMVRQHCEDASDLYNLRDVLRRAPNVALDDLRRFDDRLAAHLDGLAVAGEESWRFCEAALDAPSVGTMFTASVRAFETKDRTRLERLFALAEAVPFASGGLAAAAGWLERNRLQGTIAGLLASPGVLQRLVGVTACAMHRVDPGPLLMEWLVEADPRFRARALRTAAEIGRREWLPRCIAALDDEDPEPRFWAAWSAVLLGDRGAAIAELVHVVAAGGVHSDRAYAILLQAMSLSQAHALLQRSAADPARLRRLIMGSGIAGDPSYIPWLIRHMANDALARVAGEAFSTIAGIDLEAAKLNRPRSESFESGPSDDPEDPNVEMDSDEGLPWPDAERIHEWWNANGDRFQSGQRYFAGASVSGAHCIDVLKNGLQRQRVLAAHYLCLLEPGTPLFNTSAPAWRQQRLLAQMT